MFLNIIQIIKLKNGSSQSKAMAFLTLALVAIMCQILIGSAQAEANGSGQSSVGAIGGGGDDDDDSSFAPKRQYLIAPRIGRSLGGTSGSGPAAIWSALEEAAFLTPGQVQANRVFPNPMRSSLLYLVGNRRLRSPAGGLLPQARIGRRASPFGLLPQPRVGRRSVQLGDGGVGLDGPEMGGEVALATVSDTSALSEALESLVGR